VTATVKEMSSLPGQSVSDQDGRRIGKIDQLYVDHEGGDPEWLTISANLSLFKHRTVFVPLARLKEESDGLRVPYSKRHIVESPEVDPGKELSAEDERLLRDHYGIDRGDDELRQKNESYAARSVSDEADGAVQADPEG
jgi:sporulation protein YlmC with PRC-barrel domain